MDFYETTLFKSIDCSKFLKKLSFKSDKNDLNYFDHDVHENPFNI